MQENDFDLVLYKTLTALHIGKTQSSYEVDCPIIREEHTKYPLIPSSTFKGILRKENNSLNEKEIYGDKTGNSIGKMIITDGELLIFPVRSFKNRYFFITCPYILDRFLEEYKIFVKEETIKTSNSIYKEEEIEIESMKVKTIIPNKIHEITLDFIKKNLCNIDVGQAVKLNEIKIVDNATFKFFVTMCTEKRTRIRINEKGMVEDGALFTEEYVPINSVFYNFINRYGTTKKKVIDKIIQIGGNKSLGCGFLQVDIRGGEKDGRRYK
ncbi:type III-B CRISPR module RAMP protein Cmr4 [Clostridium oceanicum]|uniref:Type III-B CRISPR module RAMP protein Cmr4 n=1 Tax=Clostridium oceanicum TaxID=1543 RepID=A0ABN1JK12_9CLOT